MLKLKRKVLKPIILSLLLLVVVNAQVFAQTKSLSEQDRLNAWMKYYYVDKDQKAIHQYLEIFELTKVLDRYPQAIPPFSAFWSVLFADAPEQITSELHGIDFTGKQKSAIEQALWLSGNTEKISGIFNETPPYAELPALSPLISALKDASDLDMLWGAFFASGDVRYVDKIIDTLNENKSLSGNKQMDEAIRGSAAWSLASNMNEHELVRRTIFANDKVATGTTKFVLDKIIAKNKEQSHPFPSQNGDFSAMLLLVPDSQISEFSKPSNQGMSFKEVKTIKRGETLWVKMTFAGMELSPRLDADVTYDLAIYGPDGKIYDNNNVEGLIALKRKIPMRFGVFDNDAAAKLSFDPPDHNGKYKFVVRLKDNIGKKNIDLEREIELVN